MFENCTSLRSNYAKSSLLFRTVLRYNHWNHAAFCGRSLPTSQNAPQKIYRLLSVMHMSSACPWGRTPGQPGECVGEYKGMNWLLCPWAGENSRHCFEFEGKGWGNSKFCKIKRRQPRRYQGDLPLSPTINTCNIKGAKRRIRVFELHN